MDIRWESYIAKNRVVNRTTEPMVRINNRGHVYFCHCEQLIKKLNSYGSVDILVGKNKNNTVCKIGFRFSNGSENSKHLMHLHYEYYFSSRPFVREFFPEIFDTGITMRFKVILESDNLLSIAVDKKI